MKVLLSDGTTSVLIGYDGEIDDLIGQVVVITTFDGKKVMGVLQEVLS